MKHVLSQQEIDSLLNALNTGEIDAEEPVEEKDDIRSYDFRRPIKLSKEYINTLSMVFESFSKLVGNLLTSQLNTGVEVGLGAVEQISFDEFIRSIPKTTLMGIFHSKPLGGIQILEINPQLCMLIVELVCGGIESKHKLTRSVVDEFTDIELGILEESVDIILDAFESAWKDIIHLDTNLDYLETNPQMIQSLSPNEPVVLISFIVDVLDTRSFMNICIPFVSFENIMDKLSMKNWFDFENESDDKSKDIIEDRIMSSDVELTVGLGESKMTIDDFLNLEVGDIIKLDERIVDPLKMYIEDQPHYWVRPGEYNGRLAVQVLEFMEEDVD